MARGLDDPREFLRDRRNRHAVERVLTQLAKELIPSVGMRNVLVHEYVEIDLDKVAAAIPLARDGYRRYLASVAAYVSGS
jgi:uncharacterized protein YutE (UPF0331/DUF86 family)